MALSPVFVELRASIGEFSAKMAEARGEIAKLSTEGGGHFSRLQAVGRGALLGVAAGAIGVGVESLKMAGEFQQATNVLVTAAGESTKNIGMVREGILSIARETGTTWQNLAEGMYTVEKAGYRGADGLKVLRAAAQGAREENASLADVTNAMTSVMASYHLKASDAVRVMNGLKTAAGEGKMTMEQMASAMSTVIPIASANNISFGEVAGAMATLTQHGTSAHEATQELAATIRNLARPNAVATAEMNQLGLSSIDVSKNLGQRGLSGTISLLTDTVAKHTQGGLVMLGLFKQSASATADLHAMMSAMSPAAQQLATDLLNNSISVKEYRKEAAHLDPQQAAMARQFATLSVRANGFSDAVKRGEPAAQTFAGAISKMTGGAIGLNTVLQLSGESTDAYHQRIKDITASFNHASTSVEGWDSTQKLFNVTIDRLKQTVNSAFIEIGTRLIPIVTSAMDLIARHKTTVEAFAYAIGTVLVAAITAYVGGLIVAGIRQAAWAALVIAANARVMVAMVADFARMTATAVASSVTQVAAWAATAAAATAAFIAENLATLGIAAAIAALVVVVIYLGTHWSQVWGKIKELAAEAAGFIRQHLTLISAAFGPVGLAAAALATHWSSIWNGIKAAVSDAWSVIQPIFHAIEAACSSVGSALSGVMSTVSSAASAIGSATSGIGSALSSIHIPGFATGVSNFGGGLALVGEKGPELVSLPRGSSVYPHGTGPAGAGGDVHLSSHVTVNVSGSGDARDIADQVDTHVRNALHGVVRELQSGRR